MGWMMFVMLLAVLLFSAVSQQVAMRRQQASLQQRRWTPVAADVTIAGVRAVSDGVGVELTAIAPAPPAGGSAFEGAAGATASLAPETGATARLGGATFGVALVTTVRADDFDATATPGMGAGGTAGVRLATSLAVDADAAPTYIATYVVVTDRAGAFANLRVAAFDQQGVPVREVGRRIVWEERALVLSLNGVLPGDVQFLELTAPAAGASAVSAGGGPGADEAP